MVQLEGAKCKISRRPMCAKGRPNRAEMGLGRSAQAGRPSPFQCRFDPPFLQCEDDATLSTWRRCHSERERERAIPLRGRPQAREREEEGDHSRGGSLYSKEATTSGGGRRGPAKTPPEEKEDTVESVMMINGATARTLMG
jgi:hypothetical protein